MVLVVDDDPAQLRLLSEMLFAQPFEVAFAADGETALDHIRRFMPDVVILDALMEGIDGFEVCRRLKADPATHEIPILFMTALADAASRQRGFVVGAVDYLTKPIEREELLARVKMQFALRTAVRALHEKNLALEQELVERMRAEGERAALQQQIIEAQAARLSEMSTPIIPITDRILVMPLIGLMDEKRAEQVLFAALERTRESGADVLILDITGVPRADHGIATTIVNTARALRLLGAQTVLTGIGPDVARTLVELEVDFTEVVTHSTLQGGIAYAVRGRWGRA
jgi:DNA-binding response OmpR family regulator